MSGDSASQRQMGGESGGVGAVIAAAAKPTVKMKSKHFMAHVQHAP